MVSFDDLKRQRAANTDKLISALEKANSGGESPGGNDGRYWKPKRDSSGNGFAVIRFLPSTEEDGVPFVKYYKHIFKGPGGWYAERSLTSLGDGIKDPVGEINKASWDAGDKKAARDRKRKLCYVSNIYVVKDAQAPENEGKVFLYEYGQTIFDMIETAAKPANEYRAKIDPFDLWGGANFIMEIYTEVTPEGSFPKYNRSSWAQPNPLFDDEDRMRAVFSQAHSLGELADRKNYKTYAELKARLDQVMNGSDADLGPSPSAQEYSNTRQSEGQMFRETEARQPPQTTSRSSIMDDDDEDEEFSMFKRKLIDGDEIPF